VNVEKEVSMAMVACTAEVYVVVEVPLQDHRAATTAAEAESRARSKSLAEPKQYNRDGRIILNYCKSLMNELEALRTQANERTARAMYSYAAQIPEELGFQKGDILAVLRLQDDGWWEAEAVGKNGRPGLVPSNYLQAC
jgi:hypothetical protein